MEIKGLVNKIMPIVSGQKQNGEQWQKQEFVIQTLDDKYPEMIAFSIFGADRIQQANLQGGQLVNVKFSARSREYNGRYYTELTAYSVLPVQASQPQPMQQAPQQPMQQAQAYNQQQYAQFQQQPQQPQGGMPW